MYNVTITAGMTSSSFDVEIIDNKIQDGDKMFTITIRLIPTCFTVAATVDSNVAMVTIHDNKGLLKDIYLLSIICIYIYICMYKL